MVNYVFVVDTCYLMNQIVPEYGLTIIEMVKSALFHVLQRKKSIIRTDQQYNNIKPPKFMLITCAPAPHHVKVKKFLLKQFFSIFLDEIFIL